MSKYSEALTVCLILATGLQPTAWSGCITPAGASGSNPNSRYVISLSNQEVYDTQTNLTWQRCPWGMFISPDGKSCLKMQGSNITWSQRPSKEEADAVNIALQLGKPLPPQHDLGPVDRQAIGWTIPSLERLLTLVDYVCRAPAINQEVFPDTPADLFWSASSKGWNSHGHHFYYTVSFVDGARDDHEDIHAWPIRLMYVGKSPAVQATLEKRPVATQ